MRISAPVFFLSLSILAAACKDNPKPTATVTPTPAQPAPEAVPGQGAEVTGALTGRDPGQPASEAAPPQDPGAMPQQPQQQDVMAVAAELEKGIEKLPDCEKAFETLIRVNAENEKFLAAMSPEDRAKAPPMPKLPAKKQFTGLCKKLPKPIQQCMVFSYVVQNEEDCNGRLQGLAPADQKTFTDLQALMR